MMKPPASSSDSDPATTAPADSDPSSLMGASAATEEEEVKAAWDEEQGAAASSVKKRKAKGKGKGKGKRCARRLRRRLVTCFRRKRGLWMWGCALVTLLAFGGMMMVIFTLVISNIHPVAFEMTGNALVGLKFNGSDVYSTVFMEGRCV